MSQFHVFGGENYYPIGGALDYQGSFDDQQSAITFARNFVRRPQKDWAQVVDARMEIIESVEAPPEPRVAGIFSPVATWASIPTYEGPSGA